MSLFWDNLSLITVTFSESIICLNLRDTSPGIPLISKKTHLHAKETYGDEVRYSLRHLGVFKLKVRFRE